MKGFLERDMICTSLPLIASEGSVVLLSKHLENVFCYFTEETTTTLLLCTDSALIVSPGSVVVLLAAVPVFTLLLHCILCYYFTPLHYLKAPSSCCLPAVPAFTLLLYLPQVDTNALILLLCTHTTMLPKHLHSYYYEEGGGGLGRGRGKKRGTPFTCVRNLSPYLSICLFPPNPPFPVPASLSAYLPPSLDFPLPLSSPPSLPSPPSWAPPASPFPDESGPTHVLTMS